MKHFSANFTIIEEKNCPLYETGEYLHLSEKTLSCPAGKEVCLILVRDMTELLFKMLPQQSTVLEDYDGKIFNCSGCTGLIKFAFLSPEQLADNKREKEGGAPQLSVQGRGVDYSGVAHFPLLSTLPPEQVELIVAQFKEISLEPGNVLINKGDMNLNVYLVTEGELEMEDGGLMFESLGPGDLCGEMSYLGADLAVSTIRAKKQTKVLAMSGDVFGTLLGGYQSVQKYMALLLAGRLQKSNAARAQAFDSCMSGRIDEIVPAELFQIFHMHQKTGVLTLEVHGSYGKVSFREGCIINAEYGDAVNEDAIFKLLAKKKGLYRFTSGLSPKDMKAAEIGDFMSLLMEGVKRVDEEGSPE